MKISTALLAGCLAVATLAMSVPAHAARRVALLIGNSNYQHEKVLPNPVRDIALLKAALLKLGFSVDTLEDQDKRGMEIGINRFVTKTAGADTALLFYAGHGAQPSKGGRSFLLPIGAKVDDDETLEADGVLAEDIANKLEQVGNPAKLRLVILDACRSRKTTRGGERGLAPPKPTDDFTLIAYSTKDGATADDGNGNHSPYAEALVKHLPRLAREPVRLVLEDTASDVKSATKQSQRPYNYGNLGSRIGLDGVQVASVVAEPGKPAQHNPIGNRRTTDYSYGPLGLYSDGTVHGYLDVLSTKTMLKTCQEGWVYVNSKCVGAPKTYTLDEAKMVVESANRMAFAGYTNWRIPGPSEMKAYLEAAEEFKSAPPEKKETKELAATMFHAGKASFHTWIVPTGQWPANGIQDVGFGNQIRKDGRYPLRLVRTLE